MYRDISLAAARSLTNGTAEVLTLVGNVIYIDQKANSGYATIHVQDDASVGNTPITVFPGFLARLPFTQIILENDAQPGQVLRVIYGTDMDFIPVPGGGVSVLNAINVNDVIDSDCGINYLPMTLTVGTNVDLMIPAASNVRGINFRALSYSIQAGAGGSINTALIAAATAPALVTASKANAIMLGFAVDTAGAPRMDSVPPFNRKVPAGWGVWAVNQIGVANAVTGQWFASTEVL